LVIREIINPKIFACLIEQKAIVKNIAAVVVQKEEEFSLEFLLGLLNSKLLTFSEFAIFNINSEICSCVKFISL
jgi:hypothetical protein